MSPEYEKARLAHNAAYEAFDKVRLAYRARKIGDDEFLAARAIYDQATKEFDAAYAAEQERPETEQIASVEDAQITLPI